MTRSSKAISSNLMEEGPSKAQLLES